MWRPLKLALEQWRRAPATAPGAEAPIARVAINMQPTDAPWGGGNQWVRQMTRYLAEEGYRVSFDLRERVDAIVMIDPRVGGLVTFGPDEIREYKLSHAATVCLHRVNECDARKATSFIDDLLESANTVADFTVFVSAWLRDYHAARWFDAKRPHAVVLNGADPTAFHPRGGDAFTGATPFRLVTHHWSDNWMKGFDVYQAVDELVANGRLPGTELWVVGRWPREIRWKAARTIGPAQGAELASLLRRCHAYLTASRFDPGPMHPIEGVQCGLPLIYHRDGGGIVELGLRYGVGFRDDVRTAIVETRERYAELRARVMADRPSGGQMCVDYGRIIRRLLAAGATERAPGASP